MFRGEEFRVLGFPHSKCFGNGGAVVLGVAAVAAVAAAAAAVLQLLHLS